MKLITTRSQKELLPSPQIVEQKQVDDVNFFEIEETGAKLSMREAKLLVESFCSLFIDRDIKVEESQNQSTVLSSSSTSNTESNQSAISSSQSASS